MKKENKLRTKAADIRYKVFTVEMVVLVIYFTINKYI